MRQKNCSCFNLPTCLPLFIWIDNSHVGNRKEFRDSSTGSGWCVRVPGTYVMSDDLDAIKSRTVLQHYANPTLYRSICILGCGFSHVRRESPRFLW